jgi:hypothetical protein
MRIQKWGKLQVMIVRSIIIAAAFIGFSAASTASPKLRATTIEWSKDNLTKTTTYLYADKTKQVVSDIVEPRVSVNTTGSVQTITTVYGNNKKEITKIAGEAIGEEVAPDYKSKVTWYVFPDGSTSTVTAKVTKTTVTWSKDNLTKTTTYLYADKTTRVDRETGEPHEARIFGKDHLTETIKTTYPNGKSTTRIVKHQPTYDGMEHTQPTTEFNNENSVGRSPNVTELIMRYPTGKSVVVEDGSSTLPFNEVTLVTKGIEDPNSFVKAGSSIYDLRWGIPDYAGPLAVSAYTSGAAIYGDTKSYFNIAGKNVCDATGNYSYCYRYYPSLSYGTATIGAPHEDVTSAWSKGWTGLNQAIAVIDSFGHYVGEYRSGTSYYHGVVVTSIVGSVAINSPLYTYDWSGKEAYLRDLRGVTVYNEIALKAVNMSFDFKAGTSKNVATKFVNFFKNGIPGANTTNAVITKAAGNYSRPSDKEILNSALMQDKAILNRLILVGATEGDGYVNQRTKIADYSNTAGANKSYQDRFLVANGNSVFKGPVWIGGQYVEPGEGTSYAAPRIAGYVGILRHKFPNLNAEKTANVLLKTARYDTLTCYPKCNRAVYGRGEASLSRALSPIGKLR